MLAETSEIKWIRVTTCHLNSCAEKLTIDARGPKFWLGKGSVRKAGELRWRGVPIVSGVKAFRAIVLDDGPRGHGRVLACTQSNQLRALKLQVTFTYQRKSEVSGLQIPRQGDFAEEDLAVVRDDIGAQLVAVYHRVERALHRIEFDHQLKRFAKFGGQELVFDEVVQLARDPHGHCGEVEAILDKGFPRRVRNGEDGPVCGGRSLERHEAVEEQLPRVAEVGVDPDGGGQLGRVGGVIWKCKRRDLLCRTVPYVKTHSLS